MFLCVLSGTETLQRNREQISARVVWVSKCFCNTRDQGRLFCCNFEFFSSFFGVVFLQPTHLADFNQVQTIQYSSSEDKDRKGMLQLKIAGAPEVCY